MTLSSKIFIGIGLIAVALAGCDKGQEIAHVRPANVPKEARWSGGVDGGNWYLCHPLKTQWHYSCTVYNENDGSVEKSGEFKLESEYWDDSKNTVVVQDVRSPTLAYGSYDGETIQLVNTLVLVPIK